MLLWREGKLFMNKIDLTLYVVTDRDILKGRDLCKSIEESIKGGATVVQLREKDISSLDFYKIAMEVKEVTSKYNVPLIINDRLDIALACDADGLHIGQGDLPLEIARKLLGQDKIIGVSVRTVEEGLKAKETGADYLGVGAIYPTGSKDDATLIGIGRLKQIKENVNLPIVAIGGISKNNCREVIRAGADGIAVISAVFGQEDILKASKELKSLVKCN